MWVLKGKSSWGCKYYLYNPCSIKFQPFKCMCITDLFSTVRATTFNCWLVFTSIFLRERWKEVRCLLPWVPSPLAVSVRLGQVSIQQSSQLRSGGTRISKQDVAEGQCWECEMDSQPGPRGELWHRRRGCWRTCCLHFFWSLGFHLAQSGVGLASVVNPYHRKCSFGKNRWTERCLTR